MKISDRHLILAQCLGLCPLLIMSNSFLHALVLGSLMAAILVASSLIFYAIKTHIAHNFRLIFMAFTVASLVTLAQLLFAAYLSEWSLSMGILLPLIAGNCLVYGLLEQENSIKTATFTALSFFVLVLALTGIRQLLGAPQWLGISFFIQPAGGLLLLAPIFAIAQYYWHKQQQAKVTPLIDSLSRRQRVTGRIA